MATSVVAFESTWRFKQHDALIRIVTGGALEEAVKETSRIGIVGRAYPVALPATAAFAAEGVSHVREAGGPCGATSD